MKYKNRVPRCPHKFAIGVPGIVCVECRPSDDEPASGGRSVPAFRLVPGATIAGVKIVRRIGKDRAEAICGCGATFELARSGISKNHRKGRNSQCSNCRQAKLLQRRGAA